MLREFFPQWATPEQWSAYHLVRRAMHQDLQPDEPLKPDVEAERDLRMPDVYDDEHHYLEVRRGRVVGLLTTHAVRPASPEFESNRHLLDVDGWVLPSLRRQGIARGWLAHLAKRADAYGATVLTSWALLDEGHAFLRAIGAQPKLTWRESRLDVREVDWDMVHSWIENGRLRSPQSRLESYPHRIPRELWDEIAGAMTELMNMVPLEELDHGRDVLTAEQIRRWYVKLDERGSSHDTCVIREPDGSIVGLTDIVSHPYEPAHIRQDLTAVDPAARGRGIGKWLKAAMLEEVRDRYPRGRWMVTANGRGNDPMLAINTRLGFEEYRVTVDYQMSRDDVAAAAQATGSTSSRRSGVSWR